MCLVSWRGPIETGKYFPSKWAMSNAVFKARVLSALVALLVCMTLLSARPLARPANAESERLPFSTELSAEACGSGMLVANVFYRVLNAVDFAADRHVWAIDDYDVQMLIYQTGASRFCLTWLSTGTFTTLAGRGPGTSGRPVSAGIRGTFTSGLRSNQFTADWAPTLPTKGDLGVFDVMCNRPRGCASVDLPGYLTGYFDDIEGSDFARDWVGDVYITERNGTWIHTIDRDGNFTSEGDIADLQGSWGVIRR